MSDDDNHDDGMIDDPEFDAAEMDHDGDDIQDSHEMALAEASAERLTRQAFMHGVDKQLFSFLFANCMFVAGALACWEYAPFWEDATPSNLIHGLDTIRGTFIFGLAIYGFWQCYLNIFHGQMKVWPFLINALVALTVAIGGISDGINRWGEIGEQLKTLESKLLLHDVSYRLDAIPPGAFILAIGSFLVLWIILTGLMRGKAASKGGGRRR